MFPNSQEVVAEQLAIEEAHEFVGVTGRFGSIDGAIQMDESLLTPEAASALSQMLGIPSNFLRKTSDELTTAILTEFFGQNERHMSAVRRSDTGIISSFGWADHNPIPTRQVLDILQSVPEFGALEPVKVVPSVSDARLFFASPNAFEVANDDEVHFGVTLNQSWDGSHPMHVRLALFRTVCTNGMYFETQKETIGRAAMRSPDEFSEMLTTAAFRLMDQQTQYQENLRHLAETPVEDGPGHVLSAMRDLGVTPTVSSFVVDAYEEEPEPTLWGVMNAFTRAANSDDLSLARRDTLWGVGGRVVENVGVMCRTCGHLRET